MVSLLVAQGAGPNFPSALDLFPLRSAAAYGRADVVELLSKHGAHVNAISGRYPSTALIRAARYGHVAVVQSLLTAGADVNLTAAAGDVSALVLAREHDHEAVVRLLLAAGARDP